MAVISSALAAASKREVSDSHSGRAVHLWRGTLLLGVVVSALVAAASVPANTLAGVDAELVTLLRGMATIKLAITAAAVGACYWRLGQPISRNAAFGYVVGVSCLAFGALLIWYFSFITLASVIFHAGAIGLLALAWREGNLPRHPRARNHGSQPNV